MANPISTDGKINVTIDRRKSILVNQSASVLQLLDDLVDVDTTGKVDGSLLVYNEAQTLFGVTNILDKQLIDGGTF